MPRSQAGQAAGCMGRRQGQRLAVRSCSAGRQDRTAGTARLRCQMQFYKLPWLHTSIQAYTARQ